MHIVCEAGQTKKRNRSKAKRGYGEGLAFFRHVLVNSFHKTKADHYLEPRTTEPVAVAPVRRWVPEASLCWL